MRKFLLVLMAATVLWAQHPRLASAAGTHAKVSRAALAGLERSLDTKLQRARIDDPFLLLGTTRGVYLDGYGVVFSSEINLVSGQLLLPFRAPLTKEELGKLREKKTERLGALKETMRDMMMTSAASLDGLPANESVVVAVNLFYFNWEDCAGMPTQILMQAPRKALLEAKAGRAEALETALVVQQN